MLGVVDVCWIYLLVFCVGVVAILPGGVFVCGKLVGCGLLSCCFRILWFWCVVALVVVGTCVRLCAFVLHYSFCRVCYVVDCFVV